MLRSVCASDTISFRSLFLACCAASLVLGIFASWIIVSPSDNFYLFVTVISISMMIGFVFILAVAFYLHSDTHKSDDFHDLISHIAGSLEQSGVGVWMTDVSGRFRHVGKYAESLFNVQQAGLLGCSLMDCVDASDISRLQALLTESADSRTCFLRERCLLSSRGDEAVCAEINCLPVYDGDTHTGFLFYGCDVTDSINEKNDLMMKKTLSETLTADSPYFIITVSADKRILAMNKTMCDRLGYVETDVIDKQYSMLIPRDIHEELECIVESMIADGSSVVHVNPVLAKDGSVVEMEWHGKVALGGDDMPPVIIGVGVDLKDRLRATEEKRLRVLFVSTLSSVMGRLVAAESSRIDTAIEASLESISSFIGAEYASIISFSEDKKNIFETHLWHRNKTKRQSGNRMLVSCDSLPVVVREIKRGNVFCVTDADLLPEECANEKGFHEKGNVKASISVPMIIRDEVTGFISFCYGTTRDGWSDNDKEQLRVFAGIIANALERKRVEDVLKSREDRLKQIFLSTNDGLWEYNVKTGKAFYSPRWYTMLGYEPMEFPPTFETWERLLHPDDRDGCIKRINEYLNGDHELFFNEYRMKTKSGGWRWILSRGNTIERNADGSPLKLIGTHIDVTDMKRIRDERERLVSIIENSSEFIGMAKLDGTVTYLNESGRRIIGIDASEDITRRTIFDFVENEQLDMLQNEVMTSLSNRGSWKGQGVLRHFKTGENVDVIINTFVVRSLHDDRPVAIGTVMLDITERVKLEQQIQQSQKMESIGRLAGGIAHDFNNLLTIIIGNAQLLQMSLSADSELGDEVAEIKGTADRAVELTQQLLAFSRRQTARPTIIDVNEVLTGMDKMFRRLINENISVVSDYQPDLWPVKIDSGQFQQVITNLVINARDAIPGTGTITIETCKRHLDETYVGIHSDMQAGDYVMISVNDTGVGIAPENISRIFEPFFTTKPKGEGTGFGLSTCYGIVRQSEGAIQAYSEVGHGTTIKIYLPRISDAVPDSGTETEKPFVEGGKETILVVEDEQAVRKTIVKILNLLGYQTIEACDGRNALDIFKRDCHSVDLVVTDVIMPNMNGRELADAIKTMKPELMFLFISGYSDDSVVKRGFLEKDVAFIQKPFSPDELGLCVRNLLNEKSH